MTLEDSSRLKAEEIFHDEWAKNVDIEKIDVTAVSEAATSPELRYIFSSLGNLAGKKVLDVGCGLGEASVYFAMKGASVVATDLSEEMLQTTLKLAAKNRVSVATHKSDAEDLLLPPDELFDIIYVGNLFHHVTIEPTIVRLKRQLKPDGQLVSWDPLAYNPIINVYRMMAKDVRTEDEHPLKAADLKLFKKHFSHVHFQYFWLSSLAIFIMMFLLQRRNPNKERFWKTVVDESKSWEKIYFPLERFDRFVLKLFPWLGLLCWNVVIKADNAPKA